MGINVKNFLNKNEKPKNTYEAMKELEQRYDAIKTLVEKSPFEDQEYSKLLVLTDLFVEKDIKALEKRALRFKVAGYIFGILVFIVFASAVVIAFCQLFNIAIVDTKKPIDIIKEIYIKDSNSNQIVISWVALIPTFIKSFTFYGLLILLGATIWKHAKANFDQAERLLSKRRVDRLLRLFINLKKTDVKVEDLKALLALADNKNAFTDIKAEAKAPWGNVISDLIQANTEIAKAATKNTKDTAKKRSFYHTNR